MMHRGDIVRLKHDPRHTGLVRNVMWSVYGRAGVVTVRWLETGFVSVEHFRDLRPADAPPSPAIGRFEFPTRRV